MAKNSRNHSNSLDIPTLLSRCVRRYSAHSRPLMMGKSGISRCSKPARLALTSTGDMSNANESYFMIGSRDLEKRIRFEERLSFAYAGWHILHVTKSGVIGDQRKGFSFLPRLVKGSAIHFDIRTFGAAGRFRRLSLPPRLPETPVMRTGGIKTEYLTKLGPAPPGACVASLSRRSAAKGPGFSSKQVSTDHGV